MGNLFSRVLIVSLALSVFHSTLLGSVEFSLEHYEVEENAGEIELPFSLDSGVRPSSVVHFATIEGTALPGVDFLSASGSVTLSSEQSDGAFTVSLVDDPEIDGAKEFSVRLFEVNAAQEEVILDEVQILIHDNEKRLVFDPTSGISEIDFNAMAVQADGRLLGVSNGFPVRLNLDGTRDTSFNVDFEPELSVNSYQSINSMSVQEDGKILFVGMTERFGGNNFSISAWIRRYETDGTSDPTFRTSLSRINVPNSIAVEKNGGVIVSGFSENFNTGNSLGRLMRLRVDGSIDSDFVTNSIFARNNGTINHVAVRNDGAVVVGGGFSSLYGREVHGLAQLLSDGSGDESFQADFSSGTRILSMIMQTDGKLVYCAHDPEQGIYLARLLSDGSRDPDFMLTNLGPRIGSVEIVQDEVRGRLYVGGDFQRVNGRGWHRLLRLDASTGIPDFSFGDSEALSTTYLRRLLLLPDGVLQTNHGRVFTEETNIRAASFTEASALITEGTGESIVSLTRFGPTHEPLTVSLTQELVGLQEGEDLGSLPSELVFSPLETELQLPLSLYDNGSVDAIRNMILTVSASDPNDLTIAPSIVKARIVDNEIPHSLLDHRFSVLNEQQDMRLYPLPDGSFLSARESNRSTLFRIQADGTRDDRFVFAPVDVDTYGVTLVYVQDDGYALVGGWATSQQRRQRPYLTRIDPRTGVVDFNWENPIFSSLPDYAGKISTVAIDETNAEGRIWVGGSFHRINGKVHRGLVRLLSNGSIDVSFDQGLGLRERYGNVEVFDLIPLSSGEDLVVGGRFDTADGLEVDDFVKLSNSGRPDPEFGKGVKVVEELRQVSQDSKGRFLLLGAFHKGQSEIIRLNSDGSSDDSFIPFSTTRYGANGFELLPNDGLLVFGSSDIFPDSPGASLVRLNPDGRADSTFLPFVQMSGTIQQAVLLENERVVLLGNFHQINHLPYSRVAEISLSGGDDLSTVVFSDRNYPLIVTEGDRGNSLVMPVRRFGPTGDSETISVEIAGGDAEFGRDFTLSDTTIVFGPREVEKELTLTVIDDGQVETDERVELMLHGSESGFGFDQAKIIIQDNEVPSLVDYSFKARIQPQAVPSVMEIAEDGSIYVGGNRSVFSDGIVDSVFRLRPDGSLDEGFKLGVELSGTVSCISILPDHIFVAGYFHASENEELRVEHLAKIRLDGSVDGSFDIGIGPEGAVRVILPIDDGSLLVGGEFSRFNNTRVGPLVKILSDGSVDPEFVSELGTDPFLQSLGHQEAGGVIVGGYFNRLHGRDMSYLARLNSNGSLDSEWVPTLNGPVSQIQVAKDDAIYISGEFSSVDGQERPGLARLRPDGSLDLDFVLGDGIRNVRKLLLRDNGTLIVSGSFDQYEGVSVLGMIGLDSNGRVSDSFSSLLGLPRWSLDIHEFVVDREGRLIVSGYVNNDEGMTHSSVLRLSTDDLERTTIGFLKDDHQVLESQSGLDVVLSRIGDLSDESQVRWTVEGLVGLPGGNFSEQQGVAVFQSLERRQTIRLEVFDDALAESDEWVTVHLEAMSEGDAVGVSDVLVRVLDNDRIGSLNDSFWTKITRHYGRYGWGFRGGYEDDSFLFLDSDYYNDSLGVGDVDQIFVRGNDQVLIRGRFDFVNDQEVQNIALLNSDGSLNTSFRDALNASDLRWIEVQSSGKIVALGAEPDGSVLFRLNEDGSLDERFASVLDEDIEGVAGFRLLSDDRILIWGNFTSFRDEMKYGLAMLSPDGESDESFLTELTSLTELTQAVVLPGNRILISGSLRFEQLGRPVFLAQLTSSGQLDPDYDLASGPNRNVNSIGQTDGDHFYISGDFSRVGSVRYRNRGWVDSKGHPTDPFLDVQGNPLFDRVHHQLGERFFLPGEYDHHEERIAGLGVFRSDGSSDTAFDFGKGIDGQIRSMAFASDGDVFIGGSLTHFDGIEVGGLIRVNGESLFSIEEIVQHDDGSLSIWFPSLTGEDYSLESSVNMLEWTEVERKTAIDQRMSLTDAAPGDERLYRVRRLSNTP